MQLVLKKKKKKANIRVINKFLKICLKEMNLLFLITPHTVSGDDFIAIYKLLFH